ncbi:LysR family transcriptional regulator [Piscinibacter sp. XHJ-5]|uniref:LysR family transcriptional regulator n=1 Tax=Piscinibacter sp. XHJ-5 TaxID=3037797 RepID=UPI00245304E4|nr:LysR family transcriptional regulator [Piscinibacter sp. XHJ-5]
MNLSWLDDFLALASSGNFSRAAEERHMTQPAFSRRIRALEEWLGVVLFDRSSHPAVLTETGEWFRSVAQEILTRVARVPDEARAVADASSATLRLASTHALSFTFLPGWLRSLESRTTVGPVQLVSDVLQQCESLMLQGRVQFLLCHWHELVPGRLDPAGHRSVKVGGDSLIPVSAPGNDGRARHVLSSSAGGRVPVLAYSTESGIGRLVRALRGTALEQANVEQVFTAHLASVLKTMALDGRGVAWLPLSLIGDELAGRRLVEAGGAEWKVEVEVRLFRSQAALPRAAEAFWQAATHAAQ